MKEFLKKVVTDSDGNPSSKRLTVFICLGLMILIVISELGWGKVVSPYIFEAIMWIVISGLGTAVLEKFSTRGKKDGQ